MHECRITDPLTQFEQPVICTECGKSFDDLEISSGTNVCLLERAKPVSEQYGTAQFEFYQQWMKSAGGRCTPESMQSQKYDF